MDEEEEEEEAKKLTTCRACRLPWNEKKKLHRKLGWVELKRKEKSR